MGIIVFGGWGVGGEGCGGKGVGVEDDGRLLVGLGGGGGVEGTVYR